MFIKVVIFFCFIKDTRQWNRTPIFEVWIHSQDKFIDLVQFDAAALICAKGPSVWPVIALSISAGADTMTAADAKYGIHVNTFWLCGWLEGIWGKPGDS